jgi:hypothetical protein
VLVGDQGSLDREAPICQLNQITRSEIRGPAEEHEREGLVPVRGVFRQVTDESATFVTVRSRTTMSCARPITPRISHRRRSQALSAEMASGITFTTPSPYLRRLARRLRVAARWPFAERYAEALRAVLRTVASGEGWSPTSRSAAFSWREEMAAERIAHRGTGHGSGTSS